MASNALTQSALNETRHTLQGKNASEVSSRDGAILVEDWLKVLKDFPQTESVRHNLESLQGLLQTENPSSDELKYLLNNLADQTALLSQGIESTWTNQLEEIVIVLRQFSNQL
ncbi:hypothetical protein [Tellurirhabdus bombi]|uniref:hypothetical protein n=1 Tax=Tellurirhabdus bombi TaxID=2907205 RepID=UPI001F3CBBB9|nr:hypothetical protein [Tellurirhabdus bombi]